MELYDCCLGELVEGFAQVPIIIVGCADPTKSGNKEEKEYLSLDIGISMEHLILTAAEQGLGTCLIGRRFDDIAVKETLGIPIILFLYTISVVAKVSVNLGTESIQ